MAGPEELEVEEKKVEETTAETKPKEPEFEGVVKGKYQWGSDITKKDADQDVAGGAITKYSWADGKKTVSVYVECENFGFTAEEAEVKVTNGEKEATMTLTGNGKTRALTLSGLFHELSGATFAKKPAKNIVTLRLTKQEETPWFQLLSKSAGGGGDDDEEGGMGGGMPGMGGMGGPGMMGGMDMASMMGGMGGMGGMPGMGGMGGMDMESMMAGMGGLDMDSLGPDLAGIGAEDGPGDE